MPRKTSKLAPRRIEAAERRTKVLQRRKEGATFKTIAEEMGLSQRTVRDMVSKEFARLLDLRSATAEDLLKANVGRLDELLWAVWDEALEGSLEHVKQAVSIIAQQSRLIGVRAAPDDRDQPPVLHVHVGGVPPELQRRIQDAGFDVEQLRGPRPPIEVQCIEVK
jgi:hypothetical protein